MCTFVYQGHISQLFVFTVNSLVKYFYDKKLNQFDDQVDKNCLTFECDLTLFQGVLGIIYSPKGTRGKTCQKQG